MATPAFASAAALPSRPTRLRPSLSPRMSVPSAAPVPHAAPSRAQKAALFTRLQTAETYLTPNLVSPLAVASSLPPPARTSPAAILRAVFGNAYLMQSEQLALAPILTRFAHTGDARELLRALATSAAFTSRFVAPVSPWRTVEMLHKALLGRAPHTYAEVVAALATMQRDGYTAAVDALLDSDEHARRFGGALVPVLSGADGAYTRHGGMRAFCAQMRVQLATRGGNSDVTAKGPRTVATLAGREAAGVVEIQAGYAVSVARYDGEGDWMKLPESRLSKDWASASLVGSSAVGKWGGLGSPRATGEATEEWADGWSPEATGEQWRPGWYGKTKRYV